jgi:hypothetical protein
MRQQHRFRDSTAARADVSHIMEVLGRINQVEATLFALVVVLEEPTRLAARLVGLPVRRAELLLTRVTSRLRDPYWSMGVQEELWDGSVVSAELRRWASEVSAALVPRCVQCGVVLATRDTALRGGRPRRTCSNACRQAAYRRSKAAGGDGAKKAVSSMRHVPPVPSPRRPGRCNAPRVYVNGGIQLSDPKGCLLRPGHPGQHCALYAAKRGVAMWAMWGKGPQTTWRELCSVVRGAHRRDHCCVLPTGHGGTHFFSPPLPEAERGDGRHIPLGKDLEAALVVRLARLAGAPK